MRWALAILATATVAAAGCSSGPSKQDTAFLTQLGEPAGTPASAELVAAARSVCDRLGPVTDLASFTDAQIAIRNDFPDPVNRYGILAFEDAATAAYCPDVATGLQETLMPELEAEVAAVEEQARRMERELGLPPAIGGSESELVVPEECVGYGCGPEQDAELDRWERDANAGG